MADILKPAKAAAQDVLKHLSPSSTRYTCTVKCEPVLSIIFCIRFKHCLQTIFYYTDNYMHVCKLQFSCLLLFKIHMHLTFSAKRLRAYDANI